MGDLSILPKYTDLLHASQELKRTALHCAPKSDVEVRFRQVRWTLLYFLNGWKGKGLHAADCLERDEEGVSLHGWQLKDPEEGLTRKNIVKASVVSAQQGYHLLVDTWQDQLRVEAEKRIEEEEKKKSKWKKLVRGSLPGLVVFSLPLLLFASVALVGTRLTASNRPIR